MGLDWSKAQCVLFLIRCLHQIAGVLKRRCFLIFYTRTANSELSTVINHADFKISSKHCKMHQALVLAGLSALTDGIVMTYEDYKKCDAKIYNKIGSLELTTVFEQNHVYIDLSKQLVTKEVKATVADTMTIFVKLLTEKTLTINVSSDGTVRDLMEKIYEREVIPVQEQRLTFAGNQLDKLDRKLSDYSIQQECTVYMLPRLKGGAMNAYFTDDLDPLWNGDFTHVKDGTRKFIRGGLEYKRPCGWMRYGIKVFDKYDDNGWLGCDGNGNEWPVSYHGTSVDSASHIVRDMYDVTKTKVAVYGKGIYSSPDPEYAAGYSRIFKYDKDGEMHTIVLQNRVNPSAVSTYAGGTIFLVPNGQHIRPYGILIRKCSERTHLEFR